MQNPVLKSSIVVIRKAAQADIKMLSISPWISHKQAIIVNNIPAFFQNK